MSLAACVALSDEKKPTTCRVCLEVTDEAQKLVSIFELLGSNQIYELIMSLAAVSIALDDGLPAFICAPCLLELQGALDFRSKCEASDRALRVGGPHMQMKIEIDSCDNFTAEFLDTFSDCDADSESKDLIIAPVKSKSDTFQCNECDNFFKSKCKLRVHWKKVHKLQSLICQTCKRQFKSYTTFNKHKRLLPRMCTQFKDSSAVKVEGEGKRRKLCCTQCDYKTIRMQYLQQHIIIHTPWVKPFKCELCPDVMYSQRNGLQRHNIMFHGHIARAVECEFCGIVLKTTQLLKRHLLKHQSANIRCTVCKILVKSKQTLKIHMNRHLGCKNHTCDRCAASFYSRAELTTHRRLRHGPLLKCQYCEYRVKTKGSLLVHEIKHGGCDEIPCVICGKFFATPRLLKQHLNKYHKPKKNQCPKCPLMYVNRWSLGIHLRRKHGQVGVVVKD